MQRLTCFLLLLAATTALKLTTTASEQFGLERWSSSADGVVIAGHTLDLVGYYSLDGGATYIKISDNIGSVVTSRDGSRITYIFNDTEIVTMSSKDVTKITKTTVPECSKVFTDTDGSHVITLNGTSYNFYTLNAASQFDLTFNFVVGTKPAAFSPDLKSYIALTVVSEDESRLDWGTVDFVNKKLVQTGTRKADGKSTTSKLTSNGMALLEVIAERPIILNTQSNTTLAPRNYKDGRDNLVALTDDGKFMYMLQTVESINNILYRYLVVDRPDLAFDSNTVDLAANFMITSNVKGDTLVAISKKNKMSVSKVQGGGTQSICDKDTPCDADLKCGPASYCYKEGSTADAPEVTSAEVVNGHINIAISSTSFITKGVTCEKAGSTSAGAYQPVGKTYNSADYNNTFVDVAFTLPDGKNTSWTNIGFITVDREPAFNASYGVAQSATMTVRVRVACQDEKMNGVYTKQFTVPFDPSKPTVVDPTKTTSTEKKKGSSASSVMVGVITVILAALFI